LLKTESFSFLLKLIAIRLVLLGSTMEKVHAA
jgi:hypothetical protein